MKKIISLSVYLGVLSILLIACKDPEPTLAHITVKNSDNEVVPGVTVILFGSPSSNTTKEVALKDTVKTDIFGIASFDLSEYYKRGQAGVAVLDIEATLKIAGSNDLQGSGVIKIKEEETNKEVVFIQ